LLTQVLILVLARLSRRDFCFQFLSRGMLGLRVHWIVCIELFKRCVKLVRDVLKPSLELFVTEVPVLAVDSFELAPIDGD
jgi:hypothetical protein